MAPRALFQAGPEITVSEELLAIGKTGVQFFSLNAHPNGEAETCFSEEEGYNQGDAEYCPACRAPVSSLTWLAPFRAELELYGKEFGDFAFGHGSDVFLASQKFRQLYYQYDLAGLLGFDPVEVIKVKYKSNRKTDARPPMYFRVMVTRGQTALDMTASGFEWIDPPTCPVCRSGNKKRWKRLILEPGTWTGEDVFRPRGLTGEIMVSQRFKDACQHHAIKNAVFTPAEECGHDFYSGDTTEDPNHEDGR